jgi:hypothetical protein
MIGLADVGIGLVDVGFGTATLNKAVDVDRW